MSTFDDDEIEFDFFDEPETEEATQRRRLPRLERREPPRGPMLPQARLAPLLRLIGLIAFAIFIVVVLVFWAESCRGESKRSRYATYMQDVQSLAQSSSQAGRALSDKLVRPGVKEGDLESTLNDLAQQQQQAVRRAQTLAPPGPLRPEHVHLVEALELRATGLKRLADAFHQTAAEKDATAAATVLARQAQLLVASDVVWETFFKQPAVDKLKQQDVTGVAVPGSKILQNPELATAQSLAPVFQRIHGASTGGTPTGKAGDRLVSVVALPQELRLDPSTSNTVRASTDLAFQVTVENSGDVPNNGVPVTLTLTAEGSKPVVRRKIIDLIAPTEQKSVVFADIGQPSFGAKTIVKANVGAVPRESNTGNNSASYEVFFSVS